MSMNEQQNIEQEVIDDIALGKALREARISASLTVDEVAEQLNLAVSTIKDIEDDLDNLIAHQDIPIIYLRGYIVNYAKLVFLREVNEFSEFQKLSAQQSIPRNICPPLKALDKKKKVNLPLFLLILLIMIAIIGFAVKQFFFTEPQITAVPVEQEVAVTPSDASDSLTVIKKAVSVDK